MSASATRRDRETFGPLIKKATAYVRGRIATMLRRYGDAVIDDVIQNAAMKAWLYRAQFAGRSGFNTWFMRIAINEALMWLRSAKMKELKNVSIDAPHDADSTGQALIALLSETLADPAANPERRLLVKEQLAALDRVPSVNRRVLLMRDLLGYSTIETAKALGVSQSTVKTRNRRAKIQTRAEMAETR